MFKERFRFLVLAIVLVALALLSSTVWVRPALARPCCGDCDSYPYLDYLNDPCAKVCDHSC